MPAIMRPAANCGLKAAMCPLGKTEPKPELCIYAKCVTKICLTIPLVAEPTLICDYPYAGAKMHPIEKMRDK
jgi:hypothetical protein